MKASKALWLIGASVMFVLSSCTLEKRKFQQGYHLEWKTNLKEIAQSESEGLKKKVITPKADARQTPEEKSISKSPEPNQEEAAVSASTAPLPIAPKKWYAKPIIPTNAAEDCDLITLLNGEEFLAKIVEIGPKEIRYKKCDNLAGPDYLIPKSEVFMVKYPNGTKDVITPANSGAPKDRKTPGLATAGMILGILGLIIAGIPFGILALVFGTISYSKITRNPEKYKGKGIAIASMILGVLSIFLTLLVILLLI